VINIEAVVMPVIVVGRRKGLLKELSVFQGKARQQGFLSNVLAEAPSAIPFARTLRGHISLITIHAQGCQLK